jgi:type II secretory ATPase GspE/PulE/Tfp pilus assembly ATPase PilB-like protein
LAKAISDNANEEDIRRLIRAKGISSLTTEALKKVIDGVTSLDEALSVRWA